MVSELKPSIVRIKTEEGAVIGSGFLVKEKIVLTCAHVIADAAGQSQSSAKPNQSKIYIDFPLIKPIFCCKARIEFWGPEFSNDLAGLIIEGEIPESIRPIDIRIAKDTIGNKFDVFGFPEGFDDGIWASGAFSDVLGNGWVQVEAIKETGHQIEQGFSGAPIWDRKIKAVVGMVVAAEINPEKKVAFIMPSELILNSWPDLYKVLGYDDPLKELEWQIDQLKNKEGYEKFRSILDQLDYWVKEKTYKIDTINGLLQIAVNMKYQLSNKIYFNEYYEHIAMGIIPKEWNIQNLVAKLDLDKISELAILLFEPLREEFEINLKNRLPVVLAVMDKYKAEDLASGAAFHSYPENLKDKLLDRLKGNLKIFESLLAQKGIKEINKLYCIDKREWQPFNDSSDTIKSIVHEAILKTMSAKRIVPVFIDIDLINKKHFRCILKIIRENGCIVIMDSISMQHPDIQREFHLSLLDAFPKTRIAKVGYDRDAAEFINQITIILEEHMELEFYKRLNERDNCGDCIQLGKRNDFADWFTTKTEEITMNNDWRRFRNARGPDS